MLLTTQRPPSPHPMGRGQGEGVSSLGDQEREREKSHVSQASRFPDAALVVGGVTTSCRGQLAVLSLAANSRFALPGFRGFAGTRHGWRRAVALSDGHDRLHPFRARASLQHSKNRGCILHTDADGEICSPRTVRFAALATKLSPPR